jgi:hypothetical protein
MAQILRLRTLPRGTLSRGWSLLLAGLALLLLLVGCEAPPPPSVDAIDQAHAEMAEGVPVTGEGVVVKILRDDTHGSQHQRFLVRIPSGLSLLIAHNIDLAPRVPLNGPGDRVRFCGDYEWNNKGGVVHWTHHAPRGNHPGGWIEYDGIRYD